MFMTINSYFYPTQHSWACSCLGEKKGSCFPKLGYKKKNIYWTGRQQPFFSKPLFSCKAITPSSDGNFDFWCIFFTKFLQKFAHFYFFFFASKLKLIVIGYCSNVLFSTLNVDFNAIHTFFFLYRYGVKIYTLFFKNNFIKTVSLRFWWN